MPIAVLSTYTAVEEKVKEYMILLLLLETGMLGAFISLDMFLFYIFWEVMLIPMYFIIGIWGGKNRIYAAVKFFIYTMVGSLLMLVALIYLYFKGLEAGLHRFRSAAVLQPAAAAGYPDPGCSWPLPWPLPSRCRCSRCIPGCRMPIPKPLQPVPSSWPPSC